MRLVINEYAKGGRYVYEISNDGGTILREWLGDRKVGERLRAYIELGYDDDEESLDRLLNALEWVTEEVRKRKAALVQQA
jgi:hypothetical protein